MKNKIILSLLLTTALAACSSSPRSLIVAPQVYVSNNPQNSHLSANIQVQDLRTANHIVQIFREGEPAELFASQGHLQDIVTTSLVSAYKKSGLHSDASANNFVKVTIEKAQINVTQTMMKYQASNQIRLVVNINNDEQSITKSFVSNGTNNGVLNADLAVLERDFNQQLGQLIVQIVQDSELLSFMR